MSSRFPHLCGEPGCPNRTTEKFCEAHRYAAQRTVDRPWHKWYSLAIWERIKANFRSTDPMRAVVCQHPDPTRRLGICGRAATDIDHIVPHRGNWELFLGGENYSNLQGLCASHHSEKTRRERQ